MNRLLITFHAYLFVFLAAAYLVHYYAVGAPNLLLFYTINFFMAAFVYNLIFLLRNKQAEYIGFYFLIGTFLKFTIFVVIILPIFKKDDIVSRVEFLSFFMPYLFSLFIEIKSLIVLLSRTKT
tara:strand:- start:64831 stop:65199 length:369 start_codon:yes stop_codon:yes gene_type:complete